MQLSEKGRESKLAESLSDRALRTTSCAKVYGAWKKHAIDLLQSDTDAKRFALKFAADHEALKLQGQDAEENIVSQLR